MAVERGAAAILRWSSWRRWHQAWARYYHYRRRANVAAGRLEPQIDEEQAEQAQRDVIGVVWSRLERLLPSTRRVGRPYDHSRRLVLEAIVHVMQTNCGWRNVPSNFPPWQTVYAQLTRWREQGIWEIIWSGFEQPHPTSELQL